MDDLLEERVLRPAVAPLKEFIERRIARGVERVARLLVALTQALEEHLGAQEGFRVAREAVEKMGREAAAESVAGAEDRSLHAFCAQLEAGCIGTHEWQRVEELPHRVAYCFTRCAWAEQFRELGRPDIGHWFCDGDEPAASAFNPRIGFRRTQVLMDGDPCCDHVFFLESDAA